MQVFTQHNLILAFLIFGAGSTIFVISLSIYKLCNKLCLYCCHYQTYQSVQDNDKQDNITNIDSWNNKIERLQAQLQALENKIDDETKVKRRFSGIADYYNKYNHVESLSPFYHDYNDDDFDLKSSENPTKYIKLHERKSHFSSSKTSIFENITGLSTVLDGIRMGKLHNVLHECSANDISNFFPIIAAIVCKIPYGMMNEQQRLLQCIEKRCVENPGLSQTVQFFMISNQNNDLARQIWRHSAFIISLSSTKTISSSLDDEYFIPERHKQLTRKVSSGLVRLTHDDLFNLNENDNENKNESDNESDNQSNSMELDLSQFPPLTQHQQVQRRGSFTTDDVNIEEFDKENKECNRHQNGGRRRFSRSYIQQFNDNVQVFKWMLDAPVGCQFETDSNSQQICDPIHENQIIQKMEVKKVFQSVARPILLETFDQNDQSIGQIIIKQGDDLRQDQNMMFMFHIMNAIWEEHRLEYNKHPIRALTYLCIPMGTDFGAIELVENCIPLRNIASLADKFETDSHLFNNLIASTVGSYIATYICGVGDRDFDNILIRKDDGTLFHIDFGYIFGQKVSMDTAEFAITNHLYSIIIGQDDNEELWEQFIDICVDAFMILRQNIDEIIAFTEIVWTFLEPSVSIKTWMNHIFAIDLMEKEAEIALRNKLEQAPFKWNTTVKNVMHSWTTSCSWYPRNNDLSVIKRLSF